MARKKKKKPIAKRRNGLSYVFAPITWLVGLCFRGVVSGIRANPLLAIGLLSGCLLFCYIAFNALFQQSTNTNALALSVPLPQSRENATFVGDKAIVIETPEVRAETSAPTQTAKAGQNGALSANDLALLQKKMRDMGFYDGEIDGLDGPKTRHALQLLAKSANQPTTAPSSQDSIAALISEEMGKNLSDSGDKAQTSTAKKAPESAKVAPKEGANMVERVQTGLQNFGFNDVKVSGVVDGATQNALSNFQKLFALPVTGKIDAPLIKKMREIELLG